MSLTETAPTAAAPSQQPAGQALKALHAAINAGDADGFAAAFEQLGQLQGPAAAPAVIDALSPAERKTTMLAALRHRAQSRQTALAWQQLANTATTVGEQDLAAEAANEALTLDPNDAGAAFVLIVAANRRGDHDAALRATTDLITRVPSARDDPYVLVQTAIAEMGSKKPSAVLALVEPAMAQLTAAGLGFDAQVLRAHALEQITARDSDAINAWESALAAASVAPQIDQARQGLIVALWRAKRLDECLRQLDLGLAGTADANLRAAWLDYRAYVLSAKGDVDGELATLASLLAIAPNATVRQELRLRQARAAARAARWKDAAASFDAALGEIAPATDTAREQRHALQMEKAQALAIHDIDSVSADLDELDAAWNAPGWPPSIDLRMSGLLTAGRADDAAAWLTLRLARTPTLAGHPAALQLRGEAEIRRGNIGEAMQWYAHAAMIAPDQTDPRALMSVLASAVGTQQWQAAIDAYQRLAAAEPAAADLPAVKVMAASAYLRVDNLERALDLTSDLDALSQPLRATGDLTRAEALLRSEKLDESLATAAAALQRLQPASPQTPPTMVPAEALISLHTLRAQAFNQGKQFAAARDAASAAIAVPDQPGTLVGSGVGLFMRIAARIHRTLALYRLKQYGEAHSDADATIAEFEKLKKTPAISIIASSSEFGGLEAAPWIAKGVLFDAENRGEEALAAYTRAAHLEKSGNAAAIGRGYALAATGAYAQALSAFEDALARASTATERADALAGKGRALVRLTRHEDAIAALQAALDARLLAPDSDAAIYEFLGIAYNALQRTGAANRAFRRAWTLTPAGKRGANLARGVTAAELHLGDPAAALAFLNDLPDELQQDRTLLFNRALALDALGKRAEAIQCLIRARQLGLDKAQEGLNRLDAPAGLGRWTHYWFGGQGGRARRAWGITLLAVAASGLGAPFFQWWLEGEFAWYLLLVPCAMALGLLALPNLKSFALDAGGVKLSVEPLTATGRDATPTLPEGFQVPLLIAPSMNLSAQTLAAPPRDPTTSTPPAAA